MPSDGRPADRPELLLAGADRPRPLPEALRSRLGAELMGEALPTGTGAPVAGGGEVVAAAPSEVKALPPAARNELETRLSGRASGGRRPRPLVWLGVVGLAAAVAVAAAVGLPQVLDQSPPARSAAHDFSPVHQPSAAMPKAPVGAARGAAHGADNSAGRPSSKAAAAPSAFARKLAQRGAAQRPAPVLTSLTPDSGPAAGGNWVVIVGTGLQGHVSVRFGSQVSPKVDVVSARRVKAKAPAHGPGVVEVVVDETGATTAAPNADISNAELYTYK